MYMSEQEIYIGCRVSAAMKAKIEADIKKKNYETTAEYIRSLIRMELKK